MILMLAGMVAAKDRNKGTDGVPVGTTTENLATACQNESHAHLNYLQFAIRADEDGYHQIASMFRAIARGEEVHASLLAELAGPNTVAMAASSQAAIGTTEENVRTALLEQKYEREKVYPQFIKRARSDGNNDAVDLFTRIADTEAMHRAWYEQVLPAMSDYTAEGATFFVCPGCGAVYRSPRADCPCCATSKSKFEKVY